MHSQSLSTPLTHTTRSRSPALLPLLIPLSFLSRPILNHHSRINKLLRRTHQQRPSHSRVYREMPTADIRPFFWHFDDQGDLRPPGLNADSTALSVHHRYMPSGPTERAGGRLSCFGNKRSAAWRAAMRGLSWIRILRRGASGYRASSYTRTG